MEGSGFLFEYKKFEVFWDGGSALRIRDNEFTVAVDPKNNVSPNFEAAIVLITSEQGFDREALADVCGRGTCVVLPENLNDRMIPSQDVEYMKAGEEIDIYGVLIQTRKSENSLSYRFSMRDSSFFVSPDSTSIDQVLELENTVNVAFLSVKAEQELENIVRSSVKIKPEKVVPYLFDGSRSLDGFKAELEDRNIGCILPE